MSSKRSASMIIGILMALETCLILGQVSHNLLYSTKKLLTDILGPGRDWRENSLHSGWIIHGQSYERKWESAKLKGKQKWSEEKIHVDNARKLRGIYFIDPEDTEFKENIKNARKKLETSLAPFFFCQNYEEELWEWCNKIKQNLHYSGSWRIEKTAYWRIITKSSWRPYCRKRREFITALHFGS